MTRARAWSRFAVYSRSLAIRLGHKVARGSKTWKPEETKIARIENERKPRQTQGKLLKTNENLRSPVTLGSDRLTLSAH